MSLYEQSVHKIREHAEYTQTQLDIKARSARLTNIEAHRKAAMEGIHQESPLHTIASLVANTLSIGREDGYPSFKLPTETINVLKAAANAGLIQFVNGHYVVGTLKFYHDFSGLAHTLPEQAADVDAYIKASGYRKAQTVKDL